MKLTRTLWNMKSISEKNSCRNKDESRGRVNNENLINSVFHIPNFSKFFHRLHVAEHPPSLELPSCEIMGSTHERTWILFVSWCLCESRKTKGANNQTRPILHRNLLQKIKRPTSGNLIKIDGLRFNIPQCLYHHKS